MSPSRFSYLAKLLLMLIALIVTLQGATYFAARTALLDATVKSARRALQVGADVFAQSMAAQSDQLKSSVTVLVNDFGFREAVATRDAGTIDSALRNQAERIGADRAMVVGSDGARLADTATLAAARQELSPQLLAAADRSGSVATNLVLDGVPYIFVVSTVRAPARIGWVGMGFQLDRTRADRIKKITQLDIAFINEGALAADAQRGAIGYLAGTLDAEHSAALESGFVGHFGVVPHEVMLADARYMSIDIPLVEGVHPLTATLLLPMQQALLPFYRLSQQLLWVALAGLLLAIGVAVAVARRFTQSVRELASASARISSGDYSARVVPRSRDELGDLAQTFNQMQDAVVDRERRIVFQAEHDGLTGLPNRSVALRTLTAAIAEARPSNLPGADDDKRMHVAVVVVDINHFKSINDVFGHDIGDRVLCHAAERTLTAVKQRDTVVRLGSDEFLLVLAGVGKAKAQDVARRVLNDLAKPLKIGELQFVIDAHVGIAAYPEDGDAAEALLRRADIAMATSKQAGNHPLAERVAVYQSGWEEMRLRRLALVHELRDAIEHGGLHMRFQPKLSLTTPDYLGAEALVRWVHPRLGFIGPDEFIPLAESSGHIVELTRWVLEAVIRQMAAWAQQDLHVKMSINISALDLLESSLHAFIESTLQQYNVPVAMLCLELTESSVMHDVERSLDSLQRLRDMGLRLSVDDFGTGYSSLAQLKKLPIDELKIDKSFVLKLDQSEDDRVIVHSTIELGHNMGLEVVAEGVETEAARAVLCELGCDIVQGYLLAKPLLPEEFEAWARNHQRGLHEQ